MRLLLATILVVGLFGCAPLSGAVTDERTAERAAADLVRQHMRLPESQPLRVTRREDWEDALFATQIRVQGRIAKAAYFFEITEDGYFVTSPHEAIVVSTMDGGRVWVVAVARSDNEAVGLYGMARPNEGFRQMAEAAKLSVRTPADAERLAALYFSVVLDPRDQLLALGPLELRHRAEHYYHSKLPEKQARVRADRWIRRIRKELSSLQLGLTTKEDGGAFAVSIAHLGLGKEDLELNHLLVKVTAIGQVTPLNSLNADQKAERLERFPGQPRN